jgi:hypothetical protein
MAKKRAIPREGEITAETLCGITKLTDRRHRQLAGEGYFPPPINGLYQMEPTLTGLVNYLREQADRNADSMAEEKLQKTRAERQMAQLKLSRERKESLDAQAVFKAWENILLTLRAKLLALPTQLSPRVAYLKEQTDVEELLEKAVTEALVDLSKPVIYEDDSEDEIQEGDSGSPEAPEATAKA